MDAAALLGAFPLVRAGIGHPLRGATLYELADTPGYEDDSGVIIRATLPAGPALTLVQGTCGWPIAGNTDEQAPLRAWLTYRAPDVAAAFGPVWLAENERLGVTPDGMGRAMNRLLVSFLALDGFTHAVTRDRNDRVVYLIPHTTPVGTLYFRAADVIEQVGIWKRWRPEAGFPNAVEPPPLPPQ